MKMPISSSSEQAAKPTTNFSPFLVYLILFYGVWTAWVYMIYPRMQAVGPATFAYAMINFGFRLLIWVIPVFLYLRLIDKVDPFEYLKLKRYWGRGIVIGLALSVLNFLGSWLRFGPPHLNVQDLTWNSILGTSILIGFFEEIPFRGFIMQKLQERCPFWLANLLSSLLFLAIHLPGWISLHLFTWSMAISIFVLGVIFAAVFYYSKSLWSSIVAHSLNDFLSALVFHVS